jgi:hypothetical protein
MAARITVNLNAKGEFEIWLNPEGRDAWPVWCQKQTYCTLIFGRRTT